jgi:hypothetical protein
MVGGPNSVPLRSAGTNAFSRTRLLLPDARMALTSQVSSTV